MLLLDSRTISSSGPFNHVIVTLPMIYSLVWGLKVRHTNFPDERRQVAVEGAEEFEALTYIPYLLAVTRRWSNDLKTSDSSPTRSIPTVDPRLTTPQT